MPLTNRDEDQEYKTIRTPGLKVGDVIYYPLKHMSTVLEIRRTSRFRRLYEIVIQPDHTLATLTMTNVRHRVCWWVRTG